MQVVELLAKGWCECKEFVWAQKEANEILQEGKIF